MQRLKQTAEIESASADGDSTRPTHRPLTCCGNRLSLGVHAHAVRCAGALRTFLDCLPASLNVSLFNYRNHGLAVGKVSTGQSHPLPEREEYPRGAPLLAKV